MRRMGFLAIAPIVAMAVLGCSKSSTKAGSTTSTTSVAVTSTTAAPATTTTADAAQVAKFCAEVTANLDALNSNDTAGFPKFVAALGKLGAVAPDAVRSDLATANDAYAAALSGDTSRLEAVAPQLANVGRYISSNCGIQLGR
jgi:hypothetical protein